MTAAKFLSICDKVARLISLDVTAEIRFEYDDENLPPSHYHVEKISETRLSFTCSYGFLRRPARRVTGVKPARVVVGDSGCGPEAGVVLSLDNVIR